MPPSSALVILLKLHLLYHFSIMQYFFINLFLERYQIRHICLAEAEDGGFIVFIRKKRHGNHRNERLKGKNEPFSVYKAKFHSRNCIDYGIFFLVAEEGLEPPTSGL